MPYDVVLKDLPWSRETWYAL